MATSADQLLAMINIANPQQIPLQASDLIFSDPVPDSTGDWNTKCTVSAGLNTFYTGSVDIYYNRIPLSAIGPTLQFMSETPFDIDTLVSLLNTTDNAFLVTSDVSTTIPDMEVGDIETITLTASDDSLGWTDSVDIDILLGLPENVPSLHQLMTVTCPDNYYQLSI